MNGLQTKNALAAVHALLTEQAAGQSGQTIVVYDDQGEPIGTIPARQLTDDLANLGFGYGTCSTPGGTVAKVVNMANFLLTKNCLVSVIFNNAFTVSGATLNINGTGDKPIWMYGAAIAPHKVHAHSVVTMFYDGTRYNVVSIVYQGETLVSGAVDLDLPSGILWADHNVGAATPEAVGLYFSWGNPTGHAEGSGYDFSQATYETTDGNGLTGDIAVGDTYDMARHNMGSPWRLPTMAEFVELNANCDVVWIEQNGMPGRRFTSRINGNSIFFPAAGYYYGTSLDYRGTSGRYWSSTWYSATGARLLGFDASGVGPQYDFERRYGFSVRAVQ